MNIQRGLVYMFLAFLSVILLSVIQRSANTVKKDSDDYFKNLNIILTGIVRDKQAVGNDRGIIYMDVRSTTIQDYDIRGNGKYYYCVIHRDKAELIEGGLSDLHIGDSLVINTNTRSLINYRNGGIVKRKILYLTEFEPTWSRIKKIHRL
jgi:hypothetical protein